MASCSFVRVCGLALLASLLGPQACSRETPVHLWVDGFQPENVRFEVTDLGPQTTEQLQTLKVRGDVDGALLLPPGSCGGPCRAALVTVFVTNRGDAPEPPPVVRLASPPSRERRLPIAFRDQQIDKGRIGRIRWLVELWPEETELTATLSSSVRLEVSGPPAPPVPAPAPTTPATPP